MDRDNEMILSTAASLRRRAEDQLESAPPESDFTMSHEEILRQNHELQVHQIELEMQNAELRQARDEIESVLGKYSDFYDFAPVGFITLDRTGGISAANLIGATLLSMERSRLIGKHFGLFVAAADRVNFADFLERVFTSQCKESCEVMLSTEGVVVRIDAIAVETKLECRAVLSDLSRQKRAETAQCACEDLNRATLKAIPAHIAVIDRKGCIIAVNHAWTDFARTNEAEWSPMVAEGANYCDVCRRAIADHDADAVNALDGIEAVLCGRLDQFSMEYPCHSPLQKRWFYMTVVPLFPGGDGGAVITHTDISERKEAEIALQESDRRFRDVAKASADWIWEVDLEGKYVFVSDNVKETLGYEPEELLGRTPFDLMPPDKSLRVRQIFQNIIERMVVFRDVENDNLHKDGGIRHILTSGIPIIDDKGLLKGYRGVDRDVTERKQMEIDLRQSHAVLEQRVAERTSELAEIVNTLLTEIDDREQAEVELENSLREIEDLYNFAPCGYHSLDKDGTIIRINNTELQWLGYQREEVENKMNISELQTPESRIIFKENYPRFIQNKHISDLRVSFMCKDGSILPALLNATVVTDANGEFIMSRSSIYDITQLVKAEENVRKMNQLYLTLSETSKAIACFSERTMLFQKICEIAVEYGEFRMAWIGVVDGISGRVKPMASFGTGTDYLDNIKISVNEELEGMGPTGTSIRSGGHYICNNFEADPCTVLWHAEAKKRGFLSSAAFAIKLCGTSIGAITVYAAEQEYFDSQKVDLLVQLQADISFALDNIDREERRKSVEQALNEAILEKLRAVEVLREKEQMLLQQSRQAAMGEMINNIAHQWRQPLNTLGLAIQQLPFFYGSAEFDRDFLVRNTSMAMSLIKHMSQTIEDFKNFFRLDKEKSVFSVNRAIRQSVSLLDQTFKDQQIDIVVNANADSKIYGYPNEYGQVLLILLINARDILCERNRNNGRIIVRSWIEGSRSVVTVSDNAGGVPEAIMDRLFEPYFTTKGPDKGTGLGLFMSKTIIEKNLGGIISVRNAGEGAEFRIEADIYDI